MKKSLIEQAYILLLSLFSRKIYFLLPITIIFFLIIFNNTSFVYCMPGYEDLAHEELNEFMKRGFEDRIQVLKETVEASKDPDLLYAILCDLSSKIRQVAVPSTIEPFSGKEITNITIIYPSTWKEMLYRLLLFFFIIGFGYAFANIPLVLYPTVFYKHHILNLLTVMQKDPDAFIDFLMDYYTALADIGFI